VISPILALLATGAGACLGSYATTAALRSVHGEQAWTGRSHCDACGIGLTFLQTAPLISFAGLRGACAKCGARIDPSHFIGEAIGATTIGLSFLILPPLPASLVAAVALALLAASVVDAKTRRIPDVATAAVAICGIGLALTDGDLSLTTGLAASVLTFVVLEICRRLFVAAKGRPGLGFGDVKLAAALALWLGLATPWMFAGASLGGLGFYALARPQNPRIAFGPFIAFAAWIIGFAREAHWWPSQM
jgi:leader peptidase (prepilin peptidase)/N-methyltransferase